MNVFFEKKIKKFSTIFEKKNEKKNLLKNLNYRLSIRFFFTFKKNESFRLCVDYRKLNDIIIKNRYLLFNINELQNKIIEIKFFFKFDLREIYNFIRIKINEK